MFKIRDIFGLKLVTRLRVDFSDLRLHRFNHKFNCENPTCACGLEDESTDHFLLRCPRFVAPRINLLSSISDAINPSILDLPHDHLSNILINGSPVYNEISNKLIIESTIRFIRKTKRFKVLEAYLDSD